MNIHIHTHTPHTYTHTHIYILFLLCYWLVFPSGVSINAQLLGVIESTAIRVTKQSCEMCGRYNMAMIRSWCHFSYNRGISRPKRCHFMFLRWPYFPRTMVYLPISWPTCVGSLPPIATRGCAALQSLWKASFPKIGCDFIKFPWNRVWFWSPDCFGCPGLWDFPKIGYVFGVWLSLK